MDTRGNPAFEGVSYDSILDGFETPPIIYDSLNRTKGSDEVAWIGSIIVDHAHRRKGYGTEIFDAALSMADEHARIVGLDANEQGKSIYEAAGFIDVADAGVWKGTLDMGEPSDVIEGCANPTTVAKLDARACGVDRSELLRTLFTDPTSHGFVRGNAVIDGYILVRPSTTGWVVGPLVTEEPDAIEDLLATVGQVTGDDTVTLRVAGDAGADEIYLKAGLERERALTRMTYERTSLPLMGKLVRAIPGFVFG